MSNASVMQLVFERLRDDFGVVTAPAAGLLGQALADWIDQAEDTVFEREHAELRTQRGEGIGADLGLRIAHRVDEG